MYVSIIQTMIWPFVPTSGAGMSYSGPMLAPSACVNRRVMRSSSACEWLARHELDAALAAAERDVVQRALVGHPGGQRLHLVERDLLVVADAALVRAENVAVLDAVALEHPVLSVVHADRKVDDELVLGLRQDRREPSGVMPAIFAARSSCACATTYGLGLPSGSRRGLGDGDGRADIVLTLSSGLGSVPAHRGRDVCGGGAGADAGDRGRGARRVGVRERHHRARRFARTASCRAATGGGSRRRCTGSFGWIGGSTPFLRSSPGASARARARRARRAQAAGATRRARGVPARGGSPAEATAARCARAIDLVAASSARTPASARAPGLEREAVRLSYPTWMLETFANDLGADEGLALAEAMNPRAPHGAAGEHGAHLARGARGAARRGARRRAPDAAGAGRARARDARQRLRRCRRSGTACSR